MKTKIILIGLTILGLMGFEVFASEQKKTETKTVSVVAADVLADGQPILVKGVMEKTADGLFLLDGNGVFLLQGGNALEKLIGQPVEIRGGV